MDEGYGRSGQTVSRSPVESLPCVHYKNRGPADEEQEHDDQQHADDALLGHEVGCGAAATNTAHYWLCGVGKGSRAECEAFLFGWLQITTVTVARLDAAAAGLALSA